MRVRGFPNQRLRGSNASVLFVPLTKEALTGATRIGGGRSREIERLVGESVAERVRSERGDQVLGAAPLEYRLTGDGQLRTVVFLPYVEGDTAFSRFANVRKWAASASQWAQAHRVREIAIAAEQLDLQDAHDQQSLLEGLGEGQYRFAGYKTTPSEFTMLNDVDLFGVEVRSSTVERALAFSAGNAFTRGLILTPSNKQRPRDLAGEAEALEERTDGAIITRVRDRHWLEANRFGGTLAVGGGSPFDPALIHMTHFAARKGPRRRIVLIGKGMTIDTGGYDLKPSGSIFEMKGDMGGAGAVLGAMFTIGLLRPNVEVHALIPTAENVVSGHAYKTGDVINVRGGTVRVDNTDAEGRLILADAIDYAQEIGASMIVDVATLTGAAMRALGLDQAAFFSNDNKLASAIREAGTLASEDVWRLPLNERLKSQLETSIADVKNLGGANAGAITAALFVFHWLKDHGVPMAHIDIAGPALDGIKERDMVPGFGSRLLAHLVEQFS